MLDGREGDNVQDVDTDCCIILKTSYVPIRSRSTWFYVPLSLTTIEKTFRVFRQSIYNESLLKLKELKKLSGELEIDEALLFDGHRKGKRGWGYEGKNLVFGIYQRNGKVITFPVSDRQKTRYTDSLDKTTYKERFLVLCR
jgi:hypothetical protein